MQKIVPKNRFKAIKDYIKNCFKEFAKQRR